MRTGRRRTAIRLALLFSFILAAINTTVSAQPSAPSAELHEALVGEINKLNPLFSNLNPVDRDITALIYEGLTTINPYGEIVPDLATNWSVSLDGLTYIFRLRQDVLWQDGIAFTSADVAYTIRTIRSRDFPGDPTLRDFWRTVEMNVVDDYTLRFRLVQPLASFPSYLRQGIVPAHALEGAPIATLHQHLFNLSPIGTGPYQIESLLTDQGSLSGISLRVSPNYRQRPEGADGFAVDRIVFRTYPTLTIAIAALAEGEVNSIGDLPAEHLPEIASISNLAANTTIAPGIGALIFNWKDESLLYFHDQRMRRAFVQAVDFNNLISRMLAGRVIPAGSPILPTSWAYNPAAQYPDFNLETARSLVEFVSFETPAPPEDDDDEDTEETPPPPEIRKNFQILVKDDPYLVSLVSEVANQWNTLGLTITVDAVDAETYTARLQASEFDMAFVEYTLDADPDQFTLWHPGQTDSGQNYGGMQDSFVGSLLEQARRDSNGINRKLVYDEFQLAFASRVPAIVLYYPLYVYVTDARLQGIQLDFISSPSDRFLTIKDWHFSNN